MFEIKSHVVDKYNDRYRKIIKYDLFAPKSPDAYEYMNKNVDNINDY